MQDGLRALEKREQRRTLVDMGAASGPSCALINLCSNDYLALSQSEELHSAAIEAVRTAPRVGGTGSRLLSGHTRDWDSLEQEFAEFAGTEAALYFGSGYAANIGLLTSVLRKDDVIFSDELNHASLIDGIRLSGARKVIYRHVDFNDLETALREASYATGRKLVVTETVFSMDGDIVNVAELAALCSRYDAGLILDEAHAIGVHGPYGRGIAAAAGFTTDVIAMTYSCGKALASVGAFVCSSATLREHLINHARTFIFSTAMPPYMAGQIRAALQIARRMDRERAELLANATRLTTALQSQGYDTAASASQIIPVIIGANDEAVATAEFLQHEGFAVRAIRPPTVPPGRARLRLSLTSAIPASEFNRLSNCLAAWRAQRLPLAAGCS
ncbi:MAG: 8-amino-7-oxononanoate synthase [Acidobacteria bacterium]|nr:8-amino-7-oxononanoate synthase [Acidobacteriota bacterium]